MLPDYPSTNEEPSAGDGPSTIARAGQSQAHERSHENDAHERPLPSHVPSSVIIPGPAGEIAEEIAEVGPEGRPAEADAKSGPTTLWWELGGTLVVVLILAAAFGVWRGAAMGLLILGIGLLALAFNPVVIATINRAGDRRVVANRHADRPT